MISLYSRTHEEAVSKHAEINPRVYEECSNQRPRILRARDYVSETSGSIVELGCGTGDISGPFASTREVTGYDCNPSALCEARGRFPKGKFYQGNIEALRSRKCGALVLCEVLEHISDPLNLVDRWLPQAEYSVISHPLNEIALYRQGIDLSEGEHQWSFDRDDFEKWFELGGHRLVKSEVFQMGAYTVVIGLGKRE